MAHNILAAFGKYFQEHQKDENLPYRERIWRALVRMQQIAYFGTYAHMVQKFVHFLPAILSVL
jgi:hypothetical protein